jgi:hypothetical protein
MRTTLDLDDKLHEIVRERAFRERRSMGDVISELALRGLNQMSAVDQVVPRRRLGAFAGQIIVADDFDATPSEVLEWLDAPL